MDHTGYDLLTHTTLTSNEDAEFRGCHLQSHVEHMVQRLAVAYDSIPLFDGL